MTVLVIGRSGKLAGALASSVPDAIFVGRPDVDLLEEGSGAAAIRSHPANLIVNTAAYTAVDQAELDRESAFRVNAHALAEIADAAAFMGTPLIHISTDYVFDGFYDRPYREDGAVGPLQVYGASKLAGEENVRRRQPDHLILRTSWLFGSEGHNFVRTMLVLAKSRKEVRVVDDQRGCPTDVRALAEVIRTLAQRRVGGDRNGWGETLHVAGLESCSWADIAEAIFHCSAALGGPTAQVHRVPTSAYPTAARRPANSVLDCSKLQREHGLTIPSFRQLLPGVVRKIMDELAT